jgi:hypothetical protein
VHRRQGAAGNTNITDQLLHGVQWGDRTYKNHLDGYNQTSQRGILSTHERKLSSVLRTSWAGITSRAMNPRIKLGKGITFEGEQLSFVVEAV